jgi:hypothetical protein
MRKSLAKMAASSANAALGFSHMSLIESAPCKKKTFPHHPSGLSSHIAGKLKKKAQHA